MQLANKSLKLHKSLNTVIKLMTRKITQPNLYKQKKYNIYALKPRFWVKYPRSMLWAEIKKKKKKKNNSENFIYFFGCSFWDCPHTQEKRKKTTRTYNLCFRE